MTSQRVLVRRHFEQQSRLWKDIYESETVESAIYLTRQEKILEWVDRLALTTDARVLEIGCGAGCDVLALAQKGFRVHAVDIVPHMLAMTRELSVNHGIDTRVFPWCADAEALPFAGRTFDLVVGIALLEWVSSTRLFSEIARILRPGGVAILTATNRWSLQRCCDPYLNPFWAPLKNRLRGGGAWSRTHSLWEIRAGLLSAGIMPLKATTAGFGPFTFLKWKLLPGARGVQLHRTLQSRADRSADCMLTRAGYAHIVMAVKAEAGNRVEP
ncbi:MAG TPA: class I SAM-dependent methyltransferase [Bryobacteraceae bacterium]|jgi:SAM-dependent methyltransferase